MEQSKAGTWGWVGIAAGVAVFDTLAPETLSEAVDRALEHKQGRYLAIGAVAITAAHLLNILPQQIDPLHHASSLLRVGRHE